MQKQHRAIKTASSIQLLPKVSSVSLEKKLICTVATRQDYNMNHPGENQSKTLIQTIFITTTIQS